MLTDCNIFPIDLLSILRTSEVVPAIRWSDTELLGRVYYLIGKTEYFERGCLTCACRAEFLAYLLFSVLSPAKNGAQNKETDGGKHFCCPAKCFSQFSLCEFPCVEGPRYVCASKFQVEV